LAQVLTVVAVAAPAMVAIPMTTPKTATIIRGIDGLRAWIRTNMVMVCKVKIDTNHWDEMKI
jgi:hypothetical protein